MIQFPQNITENELDKMLVMIRKFKKLGYDVSKLECGVNESYGNVWVSTEDYDVTMFIKPSGSANVPSIYLNYSCPIDGEETQIKVKNLNRDKIESWYERQAKKSDKKENN